MTKKKKQSPYYKLAEKIANDISGVYFCCEDLPKTYVPLFEQLFKPSFKEAKKYKLIYSKSKETPWLSTGLFYRKDDNNFRVLVLLLCDQIYKNL